MNICLINPVNPGAKRSCLELDLMNRYFISPYSVSHIGLGYLHSVLEKEGHNVITMEMMLQNKDMQDIKKTVTDNKIKLIGISLYFYNFSYTVRLVIFIKKYFPDVFIVLGGYMPTLSTEKTLKHIPADCCVIGEGEETFKELVIKLEKGMSWYDTDGIAFAAENEKIHYTKPRQLIADLDTLPYPNRLFSEKSPKTAYMIMSRGCYGNCNYCSNNAFYKKCKGEKVRRRNPENVVGEIMMLKEKHGIETIYFCDDNVAISSENSRDWFMRFYELIKFNNINMNYLCDFRANEVVSAPDILEKFVEIGLNKLTIGIESLVQSQLDFYNKKITVEQNIQALRVANSLGIDYNFNLIIFDPRSAVNEIIEFLTVLKNLDFLFEHDNIVYLPFGAMIAIDGTDAREYVEKSGIFSDNSNFYEFVYEETKQCYESMQIWVQSLKVLGTFISIHELSRTYCEKEITAGIHEICKKIYYMNIDVMLYACGLVRNGSKNPELYDLVENKFGKERKMYLDVFYEYAEKVYMTATGSPLTLKIEIN